MAEEKDRYFKIVRTVQVKSTKDKIFQTSSFSKSLSYFSPSLWELSKLSYVSNPYQKVITAKGQVTEVDRFFLLENFFSKSKGSFIPYFSQKKNIYEQCRN